MDGLQYDTDECPDSDVEFVLSSGMVSGELVSFISEGLCIHISSFSYVPNYYITNV